ncbi:type I restriction endonuclease subunit R [Chryseobacterium arthrosphaerae]|uniref:type I restriction endonuclease subunit R n=1 Tax=Chryseobacterium arthrosphaerae TaxID=651561 RepID=UPI003D340137
MLNQNPEQIARDRIDEMLRQAGWAVQSKNQINFNAAKGIAVREYQTSVGPADYVLFVDQKPIGIIEAKKEEEGFRLTTVEEQSKNYAQAQLKFFKSTEVIPFAYESTGIITRFTDYRDPNPRSRELFHFHQPEMLMEWYKKEKTLRGRFNDIPALEETGLRPAQVVAINNLEKSFKQNKPKALVQMATGAGKTFTAATFIYRLLKFAKAKRILFLVDTKNLGEQAEQEFMAFQPSDDNRKFTELYNVQRLSSSYIAPDSQICISTIQRMYSILKGEEMDESEEENSPIEQSSWLQQKLAEKKAVPVSYNEKVPIEQFDFIVIDECHRSIYNLWKQVLDYFDAFLIGLTATPDKRTFGFFNQNVVSEYTYEESVIDGVNVPYEIYSIETEISKKGGLIESGWFVDRRDKLSRAKRWQQEDEDTEYLRNDLDKAVVNVSQIRTIIKEFKHALETKIYPDRWQNDEYEVPKTLIFAKTDSHADDIINIVREEFGEGNDFCKKVTYKIDEDPKSLLNRFRNDYYPRIAVTVDMIATGTDVKPLEVLLFMRDVKSVNYFEQMKGRGTRTINDDKLQLVSKTARVKNHFVIVDAVGATKSKKTDSRPLERKPSVSMKELLGAVTMGISDEDVFLSLANRLIRLDKQLSEKEKEHIIELSGGKPLMQIIRELIEAFDIDKIEENAQKLIQIIPIQERTPEKIEKAKAEAHEALIRKASLAFNGPLNEYIDNVRKQHDQIIDHINIDTVLTSEWDTTTVDKAENLINNFEEYLRTNKNEITALSIYFNQPFRRKEITFKMLKDLMEKIRLEKPIFAPLHIWDAYKNIGATTAHAPKDELTALVSLLRKICGIDDILKPYDKTVDDNFKQWIFAQNAGQHNRFSSEQMEWLRMIKDHIISSYHLEIDDLDYTPFDVQGGRGKMYQLFGNDMQNIINELNEALAA